MIVFFEGGRIKYLEKNEVIYNKQTKNGNSSYISKRDRGTVSSPVDKKPAIDPTNSFVSTPQDLQDNLSVINKCINT